MLYITNMTECFSFKSGCVIRVVKALRRLVNSVAVLKELYILLKVLLLMC